MSLVSFSFSATRSFTFPSHNVFLTLQTLHSAAHDLIEDVVATLASRLLDYTRLFEEICAN